MNGGTPLELRVSVAASAAPAAHRPLASSQGTAAPRSRAGGRIVKLLNFKESDWLQDRGEPGRIRRAGQRIKRLRPGERRALREVAADRREPLQRRLRFDLLRRTVDAEHLGRLYGGDHHRL